MTWGLLAVAPIDPSLGDLGAALDSLVTWLSHIAIKGATIGLVLGVVMLIVPHLHSKGRKTITYSVVALVVAFLLPTAAAWLSSTGSQALTHVVSAFRLGP
jgi:hypothetical protein